MTAEKFVWDACALVAAVNSADDHHWAAYGFWKGRESCVHIFPAIAWFEFQATQSRIQRAGRNALRELYILDDKNFVLPIDLDFVRRCAAQGLHEKFKTLRGADLIYACAAALEEATLVTFDNDFGRLPDLRVIIPTVA